MKVKSYCISLKENEKDRKRCQEIYNYYNLDVEFHIVDRSPKGGMYGCFESHIDVINKGLKLMNDHSEYDYLFIMEDDVYFETDDNILFKHIEPFINKLDDDNEWCCCLGYLTTSFIHKANKHIAKIKNCQCTHAYIIPKQTAIKLSQLQWNNVAIDFAWSDVINIFYAPYPMIAFQTDHKSAISNGDFMDVLRTRVGFKNIAKMGELWGHHCLLFYTLLIIVIVILFILIMIYLY
jgi:GR25 family glycosyltransferase involved in LPS biosynthesis